MLIPGVVFKLQQQARSGNNNNDGYGTIEGASVCSFVVDNNGEGLGRLGTDRCGR